MTTRTDIAFDNTEPSQAVEAKIREKVEKLEKVFGRMTHVRVTIAATNRNDHKPKAYQVKMVLGIPGRPDLVIATEPEGGLDRADLDAAIRGAFDAAKRRLEQSVERMRGEVKSHAH